MKTISVDFDGVLHQYSEGFKDGTIYDPPMPGASQGMKLLKLAGYKLIIFSARNFDRVGKYTKKLEKNQVSEIKAYLEKYDIPFDEIFTKHCKPIADVFLDDRGLRFTNWTNAVMLIQKLEPNN